MVKKQYISMMDFPEEEKVVGDVGVKVYSESSYENQIAILSQYLHNPPKKLTKKEQAKIVDAIRDFLSHKEIRQKKNIYDWNEKKNNAGDRGSRSVWIFQPGS